MAQEFLGQFGSEIQTWMVPSHFIMIIVVLWQTSRNRTTIKRETYRKKVSFDTRDRQQRRYDRHQDPEIGQSCRSIHKDAVRETVLQTRRRNGSKRNKSPPLVYSGRLL